VAEEESAPDHTQEAPPTPRRPRIRRGGADEVRAAQFPAAMRGYDRAAVDSWQQEIADLVERLEDQQPRDAAVKRALDEVGQETTAILQRAHEAAEEITSRSRSRAEGRLQRAEREADITLREAEERLHELETDVQAIWEQRTRLIEEMRQLADEVLGVADDALERMQQPVTSDSPAVVMVEGEEPDLSTEEVDLSTEEVDGEQPTEEVAAPDAEPGEAQGQDPKPI
jgi:DivIVA domain-containing protein